MTQPILTERLNPDTSGIDLMDTYQIVQTINREDAKVAKAVKKVLPQIAQAVDIIAHTLKHNGRLAYFGAGTSGRLGVLDASECWPTFGVDPKTVCGYIAGGDRAIRYSVEGAEDSDELGLKDINDFNPTPDDVVVAISASGNPRYILSVLEQARKRGAKTVGISSNPQALMQKLVDIFINPVVDGEVIAGSSRLKSGTAQKMILNMLSTASMIRIGKTYHNYMIDVRMVSKKLVERGTRFVSEICSISSEQAKKYLAASNNDVKLACIMAKKQCTLEDAQNLLNQADGFLRKVIE